MKSNIQLKYGNYVAFGHFHGIAVNNLGLIVYAIFRFFIEFFRGDEIRGIWVGGLSTAQYISVIIVATVITRKIIKKKKYGAHITPGMKL